MAQDFYRAILEQAPDAILYADREGIIRLWNRGADTVFGFSCRRRPSVNLST